MSKIFSMVPLIKKMAPVLFLSLFVLPLSAHAEIKAGSVEISPFVGYNLFEKVQNLDNSPVFGGRLGYNFTNRFGIEATGEYMRSYVDDKGKQFTREGQFTSPIDGVDITMYHLDLVYHFLPEARLNPFIVAGYGAVHYHPKINNKNMSLIDFGVGAKYWLTDKIALRTDLRDNMVFDDQIHNVQATLGFVFAFGGKSALAPEPVVAKEEPKPVVAPAPPLDSDRDGVADPLDKCPGTPAGAAVDKNGCPLDSDKDGVADYLDKCPNTPSGVAVDKDGCPLDSDRDGVADYLDRCPGTPAGAAVDKDGCPLDSDKDGVADYLDKCPGTPVGKTVGPNGCPEVVMTSDKKDAAAKKFCSTPAVLAINFDTNKTDIKHHYYDELKTVGDFLTYFPKAHGEIAGHADSVGAKAYNLTLSQGRADSVRKYIVETFGIDAARITTKGYGFLKPVATNKTEEGRAKNRRIEANFTCE